MREEENAPEFLSLLSIPTTTLMQLKDFFARGHSKRRKEKMQLLFFLTGSFSRNGYCYYEPITSPGNQTLESCKKGRKQKYIFLIASSPTYPNACEMAPMQTFLLPISLYYSDGRMINLSARLHLSHYKRWYAIQAWETTQHRQKERTDEKKKENYRPLGIKGGLLVACTSSPPN